MTKKRQKPIKPTLCKKCGQLIEDVPITKHWWDAHPEWMRECLNKANKSRGLALSGLEEHVPGTPRDNGDSPEPAKNAPESTKTAKTPKYLTTQSAEDAQYVTIAPRTFTMSSTLLWQAKKAASIEWGWDREMTVEDFLDTYLYVSFKQRGIILGGYAVIEPPVEEEDNDGS